jgi:hypothetical protein
VKRLPISCPSCGSKLAVRRLRCERCETEIEGFYSLPPLGGLEQDDQEFLVAFVKASGSLKEMAGILNVSYPTVRNRLDEIIEKLKRNEASLKEKR